MLGVHIIMWGTNKFKSVLTYLSLGWLGGILSVAHKLSP